FAENFDLIEGVLPGGGVEGEERRMRRAGIDLLDDADDLFELAHQLVAVLQAPRRVDDEEVAARGSGLGHRVEGEARGVRTRGAGDDGSAGALPPDLELFDGRGAEGVAGRQHHRLAGGAVEARKLADGRGLA